MKKLIAIILAAVMCLSLLPVVAFAATDAVTGTKITSMDELTTGQYIIVGNSGASALEKLDGSWVLVTTPSVSGNQATVAGSAVWTITVSGTSASLKDSNNTVIAPVAGNNNGIQAADYSWAVSCDGGLFKFSGVGSDTTVLAHNAGSDNKVRAYKTTTVSANPAGYPSEFELYKVGGSSNPGGHQHDFVKGTSTPKDYYKHTTHSACACGEEADTTTVHDYNENGFCATCNYTYGSDVAAKTIEEAIAIGNTFTKNNYTTEFYRLTGKVIEVQNTTYGNIVIGDDAGNQILIYGLYTPVFKGNLRYDAMEDGQPQVGDTVVIDTVLGMYNEAQGKNGWLISVTTPGGSDHTHDFVAGDPVKKDHRYHTVVSVCACEATKDEDVLHTYDANGYCSVCKYQYAPKATVSIPEAIAIAGTDGSYTTDLYAITGVVTSITNTQYGNLYIKDEAGNEILIYGMFMPYNGVRFDEMQTQPQVGDTITVHTVLGSYNGAAQGKNAWLMEIKAPEAPKPTETTAPEAPKPTETTAPEAPKPTEGNKPTEAPQPTEGNKPTEAPKPTETTAPEAPKPNETTAPEAPKPNETTAPEAPKPNETTVPEAPKPTEGNKPTEAPKPTEGEPAESKPEESKPEETKPIEVPKEVKDILNAAYALEADTELPYAVELTGKITAINTPYSEQYKNISVTITIPGCEDQPIQAYRLAGEGAEGLTIGDTITVSGTIMNYAGKSVQFKQGCELKSVVKGEEPAPEAPEKAEDIVDAAYGLEAGTALPYSATLTGKIVKIDTEWSEQYKNITVTIAIKGREDKPIMCYRLKGDEAAGLAVGDTITVTGNLKNYNGTIEFDSGCTLGEVVKNDVPPTGDSAIIAPVALLMALSATGLAVLTLGKKKFF